MTDIIDRIFEELKRTTAVVIDSIKESTIKGFISPRDLAITFIALSIIFGIMSIALLLKKK